MKNLRKYTDNSFLPLSFLLMLSILLTGCLPGTVFYSPQEAALHSITDMRGPDTIVDQSSLQVRQSLPMGKMVFVAISHNQRSGGRQDRCLSVYMVERNNIGVWIPRGGGGGCTGTMPGEPEPPAMPVEAGAGSTGSGAPGDPGYSYTYGMVNPTEKGETIAKVRVSWNDNQQQVMTVANSTYLAARAGSFNFVKLEGLDANGNVVYTFDASPVPGKQ